MDFLEDKLSAYVAEHTAPEPDLLARINRETHSQVLMPQMLSGHVQGRVLAMFSKMIRPDFVLEIGTYTGYSALCLAEGLKEGGKIITIDNNEELEARTRSYLADSGYGGAIEFFIGDALDVIPDLDFTFDLVFIDADKINYINYYRLALEKLRAGGYLIADNVLWSGKVVNQEQSDPETEAIRAFNQHVQNDHRVENVLFPVRDGLMVIRKHM